MHNTRKRGFEFITPTEPKIQVKVFKSSAVILEAKDNSQVRFETVIVRQSKTLRNLLDCECEGKTINESTVVVKILKSEVF